MVFGSIVPQLEMLLVLEPAASWEGTPGTAERARPDGYTILMGHAGTHAFSVSFYANLAYKPDVDFEPIGALREQRFRCSTGIRAVPGSSQHRR